jgi:transcriptional regulator with XRE-family HTH domain
MATTRQVRSILTGLKRQGFTQRDIARLTGLSRSFVSGLTAGRRAIASDRATDVVERFARPAYQR